MSGRHRVEERARVIYELLKANLNELYTIDELYSETGLHESATTRAAIRIARGYAAEDGLCLPVACAENGNTYCVTDQPAAVLDPSLHLSAIAQGVGVRQDVQDEFIRSRMAKLSPVDRQAFHTMEKWEAVARANREAQRAVTKLMSEIRRENRQSE